MIASAAPGRERGGRGSGMNAAVLGIGVIRERYRFVVREFGEPDVMRLEERARSDAGTGRCARPHPRGRRQPGRLLHPHRHVRAEAVAAVHPRLRRRRRDRGGRRRRHGFAAGDRVYIGGPAMTSPAPGTYAERAICPPDQLHRAAGAFLVRAGRGARRAVCDRVSRALSSAPAQARRNGARPRRHRRCRHRRRRIRARARPARHRQRRHRSRPRA